MRDVDRRLQRVLSKYPHPLFQTIQELIAQGASAKITSDKKDSILHVALESMWPSEQIEWVLKQKGIFLNMKNENGRRPIDTYLNFMRYGRHTDNYDSDSKVFLMLLGQEKSFESHRDEIRKYLDIALKQKNNQRFKIGLDAFAKVATKEEKLEYLHFYLDDMEPVTEENLVKLCEEFAHEHENLLHTVIRLGCSGKAINKVLMLKPSLLVEPDYTHRSPVQLYLDTLCERGVVDKDHHKAYENMRKAFNEENDRLKKNYPLKEFMLQPRHKIRELLFACSPLGGFLTLIPWKNLVKIIYWNFASFLVVKMKPACIQ